jgi:transcription initiation factor IIE alpha subunit
MGYEYRCERCGEVIEEDERSEYVDALEQHFRDNHPNVDHSENLKQQFI